MFSVGGISYPTPPLHPPGVELPRRDGMVEVCQEELRLGSRAHSGTVRHARISKYQRACKHSHTQSAKHLKTGPPETEKSKATEALIFTVTYIQC